MSRVRSIVEPFALNYPYVPKWLSWNLQLKAFMEAFPLPMAMRLEAFRS